MAIFPANRRRQIAHLITQQGSCTIADLSRRFDVSEMTIHRDLAALEEMGLLRKTRGGAVAPDQPTLVPVDYQMRLRDQPEEKDLIGAAAARFVRNGDTILIESGTTALSVARNLRGFVDLVIYTNGPLALLELAPIPGVEVYSTGGMLSKRTMSLVGPDAEATLARVRADKCFIGASGFTIEEGVTDPLPLESSVKRRIVASSQEVFLVLTPDKFGRVLPHITTPLEAIDVVITHRDLPEADCQALSARGIRCVTVPGPEAAASPNGQEEDVAHASGKGR
jgi:DeoR/GlpR family transcriptional regulator of sugar metabolism